MAIIVAVSIAVLGWIANHLLTIRAQNKAFLNHVLNEARIDIMGTLRDYHDWLTEVNNAINGITGDIGLWERGMSNMGLLDWLQKREQFSKLFFSDKRSDEWSFRFIEYQILFPKTDECLADLGKRNIEITKFLSYFIEQIPTGLENSTQLEERKKAITKAQEAGIIIDQSILIYDLQDYLQNFCFSALTGNKIPERRGAKGLPRLAEDKDGNLRIIIETNADRS
jgi:hypothetical protein